METAVEHETVLDTTQQRAGEIYARSLLALGQKSGRLDGLFEQLNSFVDDVVLKIPMIRKVLESPRIGFEQKEQLIDKVLAKGATTEFKNFIKVLTRKNRFDCLQAVQAAARKLFNDYSGRIAATLITAEPATDEIKKLACDRLAKQLGKEIDLKTQVDPSIIGGTVIRVGDTVYDGSVKNQLRRARSSAVQKAYQQIRDTFGKFVTEN